jgi:cytoskeletal protein CcmA (bactofilin family)
MVDKSKGLSIIDKGLTVEGTVKAEGKLIIAGSMQGTLTGNEVVTVEGSHVSAQVKVQDLVVAGSFEGDITAYGSLRILKTGNIGGTIMCKDLSLEAGGRLNGRVEPLESSEAAPVKAEAQAPTG